MYKVLLLCFIIILSGCPRSHYKNNIQKASEKTEIELYEEAADLVNKKRYKQAIKSFQEIEDLYPFSDWAMKAKLQSALASYNSNDYRRAASLLDEYVQIYPNDEDITYVYYLRILSYYAQINDIKREQKTARTVLELLKEYINLFPDSEYINDLETKMGLVINHIAAHEFSVGKFYLKRGEYVAAIKRFETIENNYYNSNYTPEALYRTVEAYLALGIKLEAEKKVQMLNNNFPNNAWSKYSASLIKKP